MSLEAGSLLGTTLYHPDLHVQTAHCRASNSHFILFRWPERRGHGFAYDVHANGRHPEPGLDQLGAAGEVKYGNVEGARRREVEHRVVLT